MPLNYIPFLSSNLARARLSQRSDSDPASASYCVEVGSLTSGCLVSLSAKRDDDNDTHGHGVRIK